MKYVINSNDFSKIPGSPLAYWVSKKIYQAFSSVNSFPGDTRKGILTGDNNTFLRLWFEVMGNCIAKNIYNYEEMKKSEYKWFLLTSGGNRRKWYGNIDTIVNLENDAREIKENVKNYRLRESRYYFLESISWTEVCSGPFNCRYTPNGILFGNGGPSCFFFNNKLKYVLGFLNSKVVQDIMSYLAPTINYGPDQISKVPVVYGNEDAVESIVNSNIEQSRKDWDSFETSWDFKRHPLI